MADEKKKDDPEQSQRFVEVAKELQADDNEASFQAALDKLVATKHHPMKTQD